MSSYERLSVYWSEPIPLSDLKNWEGEWFDVLYVICKGKKILYIGLAYRQFVHERLANHHKLEEIIAKEGEKNIWVSFGERVVKEGRRMSRKRVHEIENLLIYTYKPQYNESKHKTYGGRYLIIDNGGPGNPFDKVVTVSNIDEDDWW